jgi:hypothetical protein
MHSSGKPNKDGSRSVLTLAELAAAKRLPVEFLEGLGLKDLPGRQGVGIPYFGPAGADGPVKRRTHLIAKEGSRWPSGLPVRVYGEWKQGEAATGGTLFLVEGESDCWALWLHKLPALGIPGANNTKVLSAEHLDGVGTVYIHQEPDAGGKTFVAGVRDRLEELSFTGRVHVFNLAAAGGYKDPADLHVADSASFDEQLARAISKASVLELPDRGIRCRGRRRPAPAPTVLAYAPFPLAALPPTLRDYTDAAASAIGCDPALVALPALATVAGCIGNSRALQLRRGWREPAVVWAITVVRSGGGKSPGFGAAVDPLLEYQLDRWDDYQRDKKAAEADGQEKGPDPPPCFVTADATIEAVGELLRDNWRGLLIARDELDGWFQGFTRHQKGGATDRPHWLELYSARGFRLDRITRNRGPLVVRRACCSLCGTIQPAVLARALDAEAQGAGLGARFLLAMPPVRKRVWTEAEVDEDLAGQYGRLLQALLRLAPEDATKRRPCLLELAPAAKAVWVEWFNRWGELQHNAADERAAVLAKLEGYAARLCLLHHVAAHVALEAEDLRVVGESSVRAGITLAEWFAAEAERVYATLRETAQQRQYRELVEWVERRGGEATVRAVQDNLRSRYPTADEARDALAELVEAGLGDWLDTGAGPRGGRPSERFQLRARKTAKPPEPQQNGPDFRADGRFCGFAGASPADLETGDDRGDAWDGD